MATRKKHASAKAKAKDKPIKSSTELFERAIREAQDGTGHYHLRLYVTGTTPRSIRAIANIKKICSEELKDRCTLEVIDIYQQPKLAEGEQIVAAPTLIKRLPKPLRRLVGDFSSIQNVLLGLDLKKK